MKLESKCMCKRENVLWRCIYLWRNIRKYEMPINSKIRNEIQTDGKEIMKVTLEVNACENKCHN